MVHACKGMLVSGAEDGKVILKEATLMQDITSPYITIELNLRYRLNNIKSNVIQKCRRTACEYLLSASSISQEANYG